MKFLYVLVSSKDDYYYEQALMSMCSLKKVMPNAFISLLVDNQTNYSLNGLRSEIFKFADESRTVSFPSDKNAVYKSRYLKTCMRSLVQGDFLFIDVDTVWCEPVIESDFSSDIMAVSDGHCLLSNHPMKHFIIESLNKSDFKPSFPYHINSGVIFFKDSENAQKFGSLWHKLWLESVERNVFVDQAAFNQANHLMGNPIKLLSDCYNAQILRSINTLSSAKIVHYFSSWNSEKGFSPAYRFLKKDFLQKVKEAGLTSEIIGVIEQPKQAFDGQTYVINSEVNGLWQSKFGKQMSFLADSSNRSEKWLYRFLSELDLFVVKLFYLPFEIIRKIKALL